MTDFPNTPTVGDTITTDGITYQWSGSKWNIISDGAILNTVVQSNNGTIDLSKGDYHKISIDENNLTVPINFSNIPTGSSKWTLEFDILASTISYDLQNTSYDNISHQIIGSDLFGSPHFSSDGSKIFILNRSIDELLQYNLTIPYDISTIPSSPSSVFSITQDTVLRSFHIKPDGTKIYIVGDSTDTVYQYSLSTPWDLSTISYDSISFSFSSQTGNPSSVYFKTDGTKMYIYGRGTFLSEPDFIYQYTLSTPWNISTATYDSISFQTNNEDSNVYDMLFNDDGAKLFLVGYTNDAIYQYTLSTPWDISTASYDNISLSLSSISGNLSSPAYLFTNFNGTKLYVQDSSSNHIFQFSFGVEYNINITWPTIIWKQNNSPIILNQQNLIVEFYTSDGGTTIYGIEKINKDNT